jgi:hypothetical protein
MDATPSAMLKLLVPKVPFMLKTALWHSIGQSATSSKWDLRTALTIGILREMMGPNSEPTAISKVQRLTTTDPGKETYGSAKSSWKSPERTTYASCSSKRSKTWAPDKSSGRNPKPARWKQNGMGTAPLYRIPGNLYLTSEMRDKNTTS